MNEERPFDDILGLIDTMPSLRDGEAGALSRKMEDVCGRLSPLGRLCPDLANIAAWQGREFPSLSRPLIAVFAGTHGISGDVFGSDIIEASKARVKSLTEGKAAIRGMAADLGAAYKVYEFGIEHPSADFTKEPSLSERDCAAAMAFGMEVVAEGADVIVLGNAGYGAATAGAAIAKALFGGAADYWAGGTEEGAKARIKAVEEGAQRHNRDDTPSPLEILRDYGGRDIAGIVGAILAARHQRIPVILDGYVVCAAAAVLHRINPATLDHCIAAQVTIEPAHQALLDRLDMTPIMDLKINIGDGTGGAFALSVLKTGAAGLTSL
ncbi:nicotinate-nucleotide--dimethylbenzimidazole phosphoribosyltransferase [Litorimonas haliclonae]|uniref:nicotinate-nucleotide--dimethylbenzimidazole phosphoribosyltransferase n=1 Tax=Litorimonas haliclonae TaxID=2081977 RepID=UPI0039EEF77D